MKCRNLWPAAGLFMLWTAPVACLADAMATIADAHGCRTNNPNPKPAEVIVWTGGCKSGFLDGHGTLQWLRDGKPGDRYEGEYRHGEMVGNGVLTRADGTVLKGPFKLGQLDGPGTLLYANGTSLTGTFSRGQLNGTGSAEYNDGTRYQGEWLNSLRSGHGLLTHKDGSRYEGHFSEGLYSGAGVAVYATGDSYDGAWLAGRREGYGVYEYANGSRYFGDFKNNLFDGHGTTENGFGLHTEGEYSKGAYLGDGLPRAPGVTAPSSDVNGTAARKICNADVVQKNVEYPTAAMRERIYAGYLRSHFSYDQSGKIDHIYLIQATDAAFDETVVKMLSELTCQGPEPAGGLNWDIEFKVDNGPSGPRPLLGAPADIKDGRRLLILIESPDQGGLAGKPVNPEVRAASEKIATRLSVVLRNRHISVENDLVAVPVTDHQRLLMAASATSGARYVLILKDNPQAAKLSNTEIDLTADFYALDALKDAHFAKPSATRSLQIEPGATGANFVWIDAIVGTLIDEMDEKNALGSLQAVCGGHLCPADTTVISPLTRNF